MMFAQSTLPPGIDWVQLVLQGGAFGLLVWIVVKSFPSMMASQQKERQQRDEVFAELVKAMQDRFEIRNDKIVAAIEKQTDRLLIEIKGAIVEVSRRTI